MTTPHDSTGIDALVRAIEALQERIRNGGDTIGSNEIRTRTALVDPLLTALGWDTTDPAMVVPEYAAGGGTADYALLKVTPDGGSPVIAFVEAKRLHEPLEPHRAQMLNYANMSGVKYAGLTNGDRWELYEVFKEAPLHERLIVDVSLRREAAFDCAVQLLPLRWPSLETGEALAQNSIQDLLLEAIVRQAPLSTLSKLLDKGASVEGRSNRKGSLPEEFSEKIRLNLGEGIPTAWILRRWTPLHIAALNNTQSETVLLLLEYGADVNARTLEGWTPLHCATRHRSNPDIVALLIEWGADIEARDVSGRTALHDAVRLNSDPDTVKLLLEHGGHTEEAGDLGQTLLHIAVQKTSLSTIGLLLDYGADILAKDNSGNTPLHHVASYNRTNLGTKTVELLLDRGADVGATDDIGATPLHRAAAQCPNPEMVRLFLDRGADIGARDHLNQTALHKAAMWNTQVAVTELLLERGADIEALDCELRTPLHGATYNSNPSIIRLLLEKGACARVWDRRGITPYRLAQYLHVDEEILSLLRE